MEVSWFRSANINHASSSLNLAANPTAKFYNTCYMIMPDAMIIMSIIRPGFINYCC